jgi:hypothetical protein
MNDEKQQRRSRGPGLSFNQFAEATGMSFRRVQAAVRNGELKVVEFGNAKRIPDSEKDRVLAMLRGEAA